MLTPAPQRITVLRLSRIGEVGSYRHICIGRFVAEHTILITSPQTEEAEKCPFFLL